MSTNVYVDGFNLYYGALKGTPFKWLNLAELCRQLLPKHHANRIRFFSAPVVPPPHNPQVWARQETYLRALQTIPNLSIHLGRFSSHPLRAPRHPLVYHSPAEPPETVQILKTEEKRSDVNLATLLLIDCFDNDFEEAVVISNDSDLTLPVQYVAGKFQKQIGVINPHSRNRVSSELRQVASWTYRQINRKILATSQFPAVMSDGRGQFRKPAAW